MMKRERERENWNGKIVPQKSLPPGAIVRFGRKLASDADEPLQDRDLRVYLLCANSSSSPSSSSPPRMTAAS